MQRLAARCGAQGVRISQGYISHLERGSRQQIGADKLEAIRRALGIDLADLLPYLNGDARAPFRDYSEACQMAQAQAVRGLVLTREVASGGSVAGPTVDTRGWRDYVVVVSENWKGKSGRATWSLWEAPGTDGPFTRIAVPPLTWVDGKGKRGQWHSAPLAPRKRYFQGRVKVKGGPVHVNAALYLAGALTMKKVRASEAELQFSVYLSDTPRR